MSEDQKSDFLFGAEAVPVESEDAFGLRTSSSQRGFKQIFIASQFASTATVNEVYHSALPTQAIIWYTINNISQLTMSVQLEIIEMRLEEER